MKQKYNVLLITSDQQHWKTLGRINSVIRTPNLDKISENGIIFRRAYCTNPTCTPSRSSIITGRYPSQHGAWTLGTKLPENEVTLGDILQSVGYRTALIGKAHFQPLKSSEKFTSLEAYPKIQDLDFWREFHGPFYGFEYIELARNHADEPHVGQHYAIWLEQEKGVSNWRDYFQPPTGNTSPQKYRWNIPEELHYNNWISEKVIDKLNEYKKNNERFFLWASFFDPHPPYLVPEPWDKMYDPEEIELESGKKNEHKKNPPHFRLTQIKNPDYSKWRETGFALHGLHSHLKDKKELAKEVAVYYGMISLMDKYIGKIVNHLEQVGLRENTIIIFTSDHGNFLGQHGLRVKGPFHYEDMIKVPLIVNIPGKISQGFESDALQSLIDIPVTILRLIGIDKPFKMVGIDQSKVWLNQVNEIRENVLVENRHEPTTIFLNTYVDKRYKITIYL